MLVMLVCTAFASTAPAVATTYCAAPATGCGGGDYPTLAGALGAASANAGADDVQLGEAAYTDGPWSYVDLTGTNPVTIRGAGQLGSQLVSEAGGPTLTLQNGSAESVVAYAPAAGGVAVDLTLGTLSDSQVLVPAGDRGVDATAATIEHVAILPSGGAGGNTAVRADNATVADSLMSTTNGVEVVNAPVAIRRSTIVTKGFGLQSGLPETTISDSLIVTNDPTAVGVEGICDLTVGPITIGATNLTVTGAGSGGIAFRSIGSQLCGGYVAVSSSLVQGVGTTADCAPGGLTGATASVAVSYSDADLTGPGKVTGPCTVAVDAGNNFLADPKLASIATLQPLLRFDSPLVDAGDPAAPGAGQPTDHAGLPRAVNGRRDVGAFEYGRRAPSLNVASSTATASPAEPVTFTATVSDPDLGDAVVVGWSFDDGATATGTEASHAFAAAGPHTATATATDSAGLMTVETATVTVTRSEQEKAPPVTTTRPPVTTGLVGPRRVKRGKPAIFRFGSSESGGTFECRVDRKPFRPCSSPFKLKTSKLSPGRRHTFSVFAVDFAGTPDATPLKKSFTVSDGRAQHRPAALRAPVASPSAATHTFHVLSASESYSTTATRGCVSGRRDFSGSATGAVPDDPENAFTPGPGQIGSISTRSSTTDTSPTTGEFSNDYIDNPCSTPPCHYDYGNIPSNGGSIAMQIFDTGDPETVKIATSFGPPGVGDVYNGACGGPIDADFAYGEPSSTISTDSLFSGKPVVLTVAGSKTFTADNLGAAASITVTYDVTMTVQASGGSLHADPGGPYTVRRAGKVKLDGSRSKPRPKIAKYIWRFRPIPGDCPEDVPSRTTRKEGRRTDVVGLCGLRATLTVVARDGDRDSESTTVSVLPRGPKGWRTPFAHREKSGDPRAPNGPPSATSLGGGNYGFSIFGGLNVSDCGAPSASSEILCPLLGKGSSWLGSGYELATVDDPNGPFDGYSYVASSQIRVKRAALINPTILPGSPFYKHNLAAGRDVAGFLNAIRQHEGLGNGTPGTGHSLIMKTILQTPTGDARRVVEGLFGPDREGARKRVDRALHAIEHRLDSESEDPLPDIWTGNIDFYNDYTRSWIPGQGFTIPGPMRG
jgi:hypothetical protein